MYNHLTGGVLAHPQMFTFTFQKGIKNDRF